MKQFKDKVALITGGSNGIGRATALAFAKEGATVVVSDINIKEGEETVKMVQELGCEAEFILCDVSVFTDIKTMVDIAIDTYGKIDFAFNNAGIEGVRAPIIDYEEADWDRVIDTNLKSVWACMKFQIPYMIENGGGVIINCASVAGLRGVPTAPAYAASKHGVVGLSKTAALEYAQHGIRVNAVCPAWTNTSMVERHINGSDKRRERLIASLPLGRLCTPEEIADSVIYLCSDKASFVNGQALAVDGGMMA